MQTESKEKSVYNPICPVKAQSEWRMENEEWRMKNEELSASPIKKQRSATERKANEFPCEPLWTCMVHNYSLPLQNIKRNRTLNQASDTTNNLTSIAYE